MGTIASKQAYLLETKNLLRSALESKGVTVPEDAPFRSYAALLEGMGGMTDAETKELEAALDALIRETEESWQEQLSGMTLAEKISFCEICKGYILQAIADKGVTVPEEQPLRTISALIDQIETGGGSSGVANGFTVNFFNDKKELFESHSTTAGYNIDKPLSVLPQYWADDAGNEVSYPFTCAEAGQVFNHYAVMEDVLHALYEYYDMDETLYPYVYVYVNNSSSNIECRVMFGQDLTFQSASTPWVKVTNGRCFRYTSGYTVPITTLSALLTELKAVTKPSMSYNYVSPDIYSYTYIFSNQNIGEKDGFNTCIYVQIE